MKACKVCKTAFTPTRPLQKVCSPWCALTHSKTLSEKKHAKAQAQERKLVRAKLDAMQTKPQLVKKAQTAFNAFIRARDAGKPCICCGKPLAKEGDVGGGFDCGHYRSVGAAPHLRFNEMNAHAQNKHCNRWLAGNHVEYRAGLIERIGIMNVEILEKDNVVRKYTREGLIEIARYYRAETARIKKERGNKESEL